MSHIRSCFDGLRPGNPKDSVIFIIVCWARSPHRARRNIAELPTQVQLRRIEPAHEQILRKNSFEVFLRMTGCGVSFPCVPSKITSGRVLPLYPFEVPSGLRAPALPMKVCVKKTNLRVLKSPLSIIEDRIACMAVLLFLRPDLKIAWKLLY